MVVYRMCTKFCEIIFRSLFGGGSWGFIFVGVVFRGYTHLARLVIFNALLLATL